MVLLLLILQLRSRLTALPPRAGERRRQLGVHPDARPGPAAGIGHLLRGEPRVVGVGRGRHRLGLDRYRLQGAVVDEPEGERDEPPVVILPEPQVSALPDWRGSEHADAGDRRGAENKHQVSLGRGTQSPPCGEVEAAGPPVWGSTRR